MRNKKAGLLTLFAAVMAAVSCTACGQRVRVEAGSLQAISRCVEGCTCTDCICCQNAALGTGENLAAADISSVAVEENQEETASGDTEQNTENSENTENNQSESNIAEDEGAQDGTEPEGSDTTDTQQQGTDIDKNNPNGKNTDTNNDKERENGENTENENGKNTKNNSNTETESDSTQEQTQELNEIERLSEGEKAARRKQQLNFVKARDGLYKLKNSKDKTSKINQMDKQILANNTFDFSKKNVVFIGDSITEGITSAVDQNGNFVSYVTYANSYLHFQRVLNHGKGGRMFSAYGGEDFSLALNFGNVTNVDSDIIVVFAGINDYLADVSNKRFGNAKDVLSTAGYCGSVRYFMKQLKEYYGDREVFFVTMYNMSKKSTCAYTDYNGQPTLGDFMKVERELAKEFGFHVIDLYDIGFMDCSTKESADYYLRDGLHPKDNGNIVLGEHIAAELSLYFSQKEGS